MRRAKLLVAMVVVAWSLPVEGSGQVATSRREMVPIPAGSYLPHYARDRRPVEVEAFLLDRHPVTREQYAKFIQANPEWRRSAVKPIFAGAGYLRDWSDDLSYGGPMAANLPVVSVSWFAAKNYCEWQVARLPTLDEWEYVASASETRRDAAREAGFIQRLLDLSTQRLGAERPVGSGLRNVYGVHDLHGLVAEWVLDFNSVEVGGDSRSGAKHDPRLYCAAGALKATDPNNYPAFLRFAMRGGLNASSTVGNVGFRCARSL